MPSHYSQHLSPSHHPVIQAFELTENASEFRKLSIAFKAAMSSLSDLKSSSNLGIDRQEVPPGRGAESLGLDQRKNSHTNIRIFRQALLVVCVTAFLISIHSYDPSDTRQASQGTLSRVCLPAVSGFILTAHQDADI